MSLVRIAEDKEIRHSTRTATMPLQYVREVVSKQNTAGAHRQRATLKTYVWRRQTLSELADSTGLSIRFVQREIGTEETSSHLSVPTATCVAADMTFWGRGYGVIVFRFPTLKKNLWWKESLFETQFVYLDGLSKLHDGKRGVAEVFERAEIPVQYCQFHQVRTVTKYLTRKPHCCPSRIEQRTPLQNRLRNTKRSHNIATIFVY